MTEDGNEESYTGMDNVSVAVLKAACVTMAMLPSLTKEDLRDLFPGPEHFLRRRTIWHLVHGESEGRQSDHSGPENSSLTCSPSMLVRSSSVNLCSPTTHKSPNPRHKDCSEAAKTVQLQSPQYVIYTDTELEQARSTFYEKQRAGQDGEYILSKELRCRLIRNTVTSMISIKRATGDDFKYPCSRELTAMAKRLIEYYPMLRDKSPASCLEWESVKRQLLKRMQNVTTPKKKQGATPSRKRPRSLSFQSSQETCTEETDDSMSSPNSLDSPNASTVIIDSSPSTEGDEESPLAQVRHYKALQDMYKNKKKPNMKDVSQLLDLEFQARRSFIDCDSLKEQDRPMKILQAYPCFSELDHIMDELGRILDRGNLVFKIELKNRWQTFFNQAQFYGVFKKLTKPPVQDQVKSSVAVLKALPEMFPSAVALPKKLGHPSEALLHILESSEEPNIFLQSRPLISPVVVVSEANCILAIGAVPVLTFPKEDISESVMYLLGCYYTFHLTYPKCISTLLSVLQTEVLLDAIHERDMTTSYKKAMAEWEKFNN